MEIDIPPQRRLLRFGVFEADAKTGELRKQGRRIRLAAQPFEILLLLLESPGDLVTREEIQKRLWPDGTFVDFDHGLNAGIAKLREALGDSAANPRFVETIAKRGYRFIAPVEAEQGPAPGVQPRAPSRLGPQQEASANPESVRPEKIVQPGSNRLQRMLTRPEEVSQNHPALSQVLFLLAQIMYLSFYLVVLAYPGEVTDRLLVATASALSAAAVILTAAVGVPVRLYLISGVLFRARGTRRRFLSLLFPVILVLDILWAASPFLLVPRINVGLALAATAALAYLPFAQRTLVLMGALGAGSSEEVAGKQ